MSTYYQYRDVSVMIAHKLRSLEGWSVYGYHADESDSMTDYYSPAYWNGIAEKNGYILVYNCNTEAKETQIKKYNYDGKSTDYNMIEKIKKLEQMTVERGASEQEEQTARNMIEKLKDKQSEKTEKYIVTGVIPGHMANPPRCNWHIEKDGVILAKGSGLLKFAHVDDYYKYDRKLEDLNEWRKDEKSYIEKYVCDNMRRWNETEEKATSSALEHIEELKEDEKLIKQFEQFINKVDTTCGCLVGDGEIETYEKIIVTEYKKEIKAIETENGNIMEDQCFIVKTNFNYGHSKGYVYKIKKTEYNGKINYHAVKMNGKLTKECNGISNSSNYWYIGNDFIKWFEKGSLAWCELKEVKTPYDVEKVVKKVTKTSRQETSQKQTQKASEQINNSYTYEVTEDVDTRTEEKIFLVRVKEKLNREEYLQVNNFIKSIGGYYSRFKHAFIFKSNPTEILQSEKQEQNSKTDEKICEESKTSKQEIKYTIEEDRHTKTGDKIYIVKTDCELSKNEFIEVKRKLATLKGFYSGFKSAFIFKYDPTEILTTAQL